MELVDEFPGTSEHKGATMRDEFLSEQLCHGFRHDNGLAESCGKHDLAAPSFAKRRDESGDRLVLIVPELSAGRRVLRTAAGKLQKCRRLQSLYLDA